MLMVRGIDASDTRACGTSAHFLFCDGECTVLTRRCGVVTRCPRDRASQSGGEERAEADTDKSQCERPTSDMGVGRR